MTRLMTTPILMVALLFAACGSNKFQAYSSADKPLFAAINELNKHPQNAKAQNDLRVLFEQAVARHENAIGVYSQGTDEKRFDKMLNELSSLQHIYTSLQMVHTVSAITIEFNNRGISVFLNGAIIRI